jgi:ABC-type sugar transport system substrate-binding protein
MRPRCLWHGVRVALAGIAVGVAAAPAATVTSGALVAEVTTSPFRLDFRTTAGTPVLAQAAAGAIGFRTTTGWQVATVAQRLRQEDGGLHIDATSSDPAGALSIRITPAGTGVIAVEARLTGNPADVLALGAAFTTAAEKRRNTLAGVGPAKTRKRSVRGVGRAGMPAGAPTTSKRQMSGAAAVANWW